MAAGGLVLSAGRDAVTLQNEAKMRRLQSLPPPPAPEAPPPPPPPPRGE